MTEMNAALNEQTIFFSAIATKIGSRDLSWHHNMQEMTHSILCTVHYVYDTFVSQMN